MAARRKKSPPEETKRGTTGRFVPCPAMLWRHPRSRRAFEVKWSVKRNRVHYYYACGECEPKCQVFLNDWTEKDGWTLPEAEAAGFEPKCTDERRLELLEELGLQQATPQVPPLPPDWRPTGPLPYVSVPLRKKKKKPKPK